MSIKAPLFAMLLACAALLTSCGDAREAKLGEFAREIEANGLSIALPQNDAQTALSDAAESAAITRQELAELVGEDAVAASESHSGEVEATADASLYTLLDSETSYTVTGQSVSDDTADITCTVKQPDLETWMAGILDGTRKAAHGLETPEALADSIEYDIASGNMPYRSVETVLHCVWDGAWRLELDDASLDAATCGLLSAYDAIMAELNAAQ